MAIFHAALKVFSRARGHTATGAAAYRAGTSLRDERTGLTYDYRRRSGVVDVRTFAPLGAPSWVDDPGRLWNAAERAEVRRNAAVARELEIALPAELDASRRSVLVADLADLLVSRFGVAVMAALHAPTDGADARAHHVHLLMTTRKVTAAGLGSKIRELDDRKTGPVAVKAVRAEVARRINRHLERAGILERVDHRTLLEQARDAESRGDYAAALLLTRTPQTQLGKTATAARRRGIVLDRHTQAETRGRENQTALAGFLAAAEREGRLVPTPARPGPAQARMDRRREGMASPAPLALGRTHVRLGMARGAGSHVLNEQAHLGEEALRIQADLLRDYLSRLEEALRSILIPYAENHRLGIEDIQALAQHCRHDARCIGLLRQTREAHAVWERAQSRSLRRRDSHGEAMAQTAEEQKAWIRVYQEPQPKVWRPTDRRAWAERRRRQRARLIQARDRETQAAKAVTPEALAGYAALETKARDAVLRLEQQRRARYPLPSDSIPAPVRRTTVRTRCRPPQPEPPLPRPTAPDSAPVRPRRVPR